MLKNLHDHQYIERQAGWSSQLKSSDTSIFGAEAASETQGQMIELPSFLDLGYAGELKQALQEAMQRTGQLTINGAAVESITSPCIQVLLSTEKSLSAFGKSLHLIDASPALESAFTDLGLNHMQGWSNTQ